MKSIWIGLEELGYTPTCSFLAFKTGHKDAMGDTLFKLVYGQEVVSMDYLTSMHAMLLNRCRDKYSMEGRLLQLMKLDEIRLAQIGNNKLRMSM